MARRNPIETAKQQAEIARLRLEAFRDREALRRLKAVTRAYDAARPNQYHPRRGDKRSADAVMTHAGTRLREIARYLDENSDIAIAVFNDLTDKVIGRGIGIEPMTTDAGGRLHARTNTRIRELLAAQWAEPQDARREFSAGELQRALFRTMLRDGEVIIKHVEGTAAAIRHRGPIPYSLEVLEADHLPFDLFKLADDGNRIVHGVELNAWGEPVAFHLTREHPGDLHVLRVKGSQFDTQRIPALGVTHLKFARRIGQTRGVTILHGVLNRLQDVKDYDESELIAARVASAFTVAITRSDSFQGNLTAVDGKRQYELAPGLIIDDLLPGESVETISSNRPNSAYKDFRHEQIRGVAGGTGTSASSVAKRYDGTYSAQRQELVETEPAYAALRTAFVAKFLREWYRRFIDLARIAGALDVRGIHPASLYTFEAIEPGIAWIDPLKEAKADREAIAAKIASRHQIIRKRGGVPAEVDAQIEADPLASEAPVSDAESAPTDDADDDTPTTEAA